ncbi:hypothetical protein C0J52_11214 [Blattella germanica]|nr:hypothetical protein C0J52_11214 [Blattella germanica]
MIQFKERKPVKIEDVQSLVKESVRMRDKDKVEQMVNQLIEGGREKLQLISDFDRTLTKQHMDGKPTLSSFCM